MFNIDINSFLNFFIRVWYLIYQALFNKEMLDMIPYCHYYMVYLKSLVYYFKLDSSVFKTISSFFYFKLSESMLDTGL